MIGFKTNQNNQVWTFPIHYFPCPILDQLGPLRGGGGVTYVSRLNFKTCCFAY